MISAWYNLKKGSIIWIQKELKMPCSTLGKQCSTLGKQCSALGKKVFIYFLNILEMIEKYKFSKHIFNLHQALIISKKKKQKKR